MRLKIVLLVACLSALVAGCGALDRREEVVITATPNAAQRGSAPGELPDVQPALAADTGSFDNQTALLDGVCIEFLLSAAGETFVWDTPEALAEFYDRVDESELCRAPVARGEFDFTAHALAGAIAVATGCDAAFQVGALTEDVSARAQTLALELRIETGCDYELVEPLLVAVPRPPADTALRVEVQRP